MTAHEPWLSLPDEDPPERGFAELMAAARVKAESMANPPWWKRLFAVARRPPVLALATVVVVLCGVIVVGRPHDAAMSPAPTVDVPAGSLDTRARGITPESPPPPAVQQAPLGQAAEAPHEEKGRAVEGKKAPADPLARCRAAAARRDCVAVKACVAGVPATYKASATNDAALKSCL